VAHGGDLVFVLVDDPPRLTGCLHEHIMTGDAEDLDQLAQ
jgi:hypothetical protein